MTLSTTYNLTLRPFNGGDPEQGREVIDLLKKALTLTKWFPQEVLFKLSEQLGNLRNGHWFCQYSSLSVLCREIGIPDLSAGPLVWDTDIVDMLTISYQHLTTYSLCKQKPKTKTEKSLTDGLLSSTMVLGTK